MKLLLPLVFLILSYSAFAQIAPSTPDYSSHVPCVYQSAQAVIKDASAKFSGSHVVLTSGLDLDFLARLESFPVINMYAGVIALKSRTTNKKSEIYYSVRAGSIGVDANETPVYKCRVSVAQIKRSYYVELLRQYNP